MSTHSKTPESLSSPSERLLHTKDMRPVDRDPYDRCNFIMLPAIPPLKLGAPLRKNDCGDFGSSLTASALCILLWLRDSTREHRQSESEGDAQAR